MQQTLRVDTADVRAMAGRWDTAVGELTSTVVPAGLGLPCQLSAVAVSAAHDDVAAFTAGLAAQVGARATAAAQADSRYRAHEAVSATALAAVASSVASM